MESPKSHCPKPVESTDERKKDIVKARATKKKLLAASEQNANIRVSMTTCRQRTKDMIHEGEAAPGTNSNQFKFVRLIAVTK